MNKLSDKAMGICDAYIIKGCRAECPLSKACTHPGPEDRETFNDRMNKAADLVEDES